MKAGIEDVEGECLADPPALVSLSLCAPEVGAHGASFPRQTLQHSQSVLSHNSDGGAHANHLHD